MQNSEPVEALWKVAVVWSTYSGEIVRNHPAYLQASSRSAESCFADYPPKAREAGIEGTTTLRYTISTDGDVKDVRVEKSSGNDDLDAAAVKCSIKLRYEPAYKDDWPIESLLLRNVVWKLDTKGRKLKFAQPPISCARFYRVKPEQLVGIDGTTELTFTIDKGEVSDVSVTHSSGNDDLDWAAIHCIKTWRFEQATVDGKPITVPGHAKIAWKDALPPPE
jgi:protein TonB